MSEGKALHVAEALVCPWGFHISRLLLGVVFVYASYDKILHPQAFARAVHAYQVLPDMLVNPTALVLPWLELLIGLCLLCNRLLPGASAIGAMLLLVFVAALFFNRMRGLDIRCGCFSQTTAGPAGWTTMARDLGFLAVALYLLFAVWRRPARSPSLIALPASRKNRSGATG